MVEKSINTHTNIFYVVKLTWEVSNASSPITVTSVLCIFTLPNNFKAVLPSVGMEEGEGRSFPILPHTELHITSEHRNLGDGIMCPNYIL